VLAGLYRFASEYEVDGTPLYTKALPTRGLRDLKKRVAYRAMSEQDLAAFFRALPGADTPKGARDRALFLTYLYTAKRRCEISRLKWGNIEASTIREKGGISRQGYVFRYSAKGHSREIKTAELPLPAWVAIKRYLEVSGRLTVIKPDEYVFTSTCFRDSEKPNAPLNPDYIGQLFKHYVARARLDPSFTVHCLRHTSARNRLQAGQDLFDLKEVLGHEDISTTWRYAKSIQGVADSASTLLESQFAFLTE
jgi:integrase